jgi:hypothetical protein
MTSDDPELDQADLAAIAALIDQSSLGSAEARAARDEVDPETMMTIRERVRLDAPPLGWDSLPLSADVLRKHDELAPGPDGRAVRSDPAATADLELFAVNPNGDVCPLGSGGELRLGRADRTVWSVYSVERGTHRHECELELADIGNQSGCEDTWRLRIGIIWRVSSADLVLRRRFASFDRDFIPAIRWRLVQLLHGVEGPLPLVTRLALEAAVVTALGAVGIQAEVAVAPTFRRQVLAVATGAQYLVARMDKQGARSARAYYGHCVDDLLVGAPDHHSDLSAFCDKNFAALVGALHVAPVTPEFALDVAKAAFAEFLPRWEDIQPDERVHHLAALAVRELGRARKADPRAPQRPDGRPDGDPPSGDPADDPARPRGHERFEEIVELYGGGQSESEISATLAVPLHEVKGVVASSATLRPRSPASDVRQLPT